MMAKPAPEPAPSPVRPRAGDGASGDLLPALGVAAFISIGAVILYPLALLTKDSMAAGNRLQAESASKASMVCKDGKMVRGDGSFIDFLTEPPVFQCNDWATTPLGNPPTSPGFRAGY